MAVVIDFVAPSTLVRESPLTSALPIVRNGPPGTFVVFPVGFKVSLPTDQIVSADDANGHARVEFGGMQFVGADDGRLTFLRVREILSEEQLSPDRSHIMRLDGAWVASVTIDGSRAWPVVP